MQALCTKPNYWCTCHQVLEKAYEVSFSRTIPFLSIFLPAFFSIEISLEVLVWEQFCCWMLFLEHLLILYVQYVYGLPFDGHQPHGLRR